MLAHTPVCGPRTNLGGRKAGDVDDIAMMMAWMDAQEDLPRSLQAR